jgi:hypothetical protein
VTAARWLVLTWRLPAVSSTPRVATWRSLQRLGAVTLTPGAAVLPFTEDLLEQLEWIAEDIVQRGGEAYVLPVTDLREADEAEIRRRLAAERSAEFGELRVAAERLSRSELDRTRYERELATLERGLARAIERDHFVSGARTGAQRAIRQAGKRREH